MNKELLEKIKESISSLIPITLIILILHFTVAPIPDGTLKLFFIGSIMLILGMGLFTLGADMSMMPMGEKIGSYLTKSKKIILILASCLLIGILITVAEPDLQVLARQVPSISDFIIIWCVALGVGIFLVVAMLRTLFQIKLHYILTLLYLIVFILAAFTNKDFLSVAFDSGGVTTGPITVPFIMALGIGMATTRGDKSSEEDSFGLVALCSIGPILAVLIMGMFYDTSSGSYTQIENVQVNTLLEAFNLFKANIPLYCKEVALALAPIIILLILFQLFVLKLSKKYLIKVSIGILYTYLGLVLFLTGVNVGFMPAGNYIGGKIASLSYNWILIPLAMIIGYFIVSAEPAVHVLNKQVEEISGGAISRKMIQLGLSIGVSISLGLAMIRILTGLSIWYFLLPGYLIAISLSFFVPPIFTAIAFDSGGVASGPMTATFLLPFAMGACNAIGGNILTDAFGIVAMVAMTPLITIQILGMVYKIKVNRSEVEQLLISDNENKIIKFD